MTVRNIDVPLGDGDETITLTVTGCPCGADDLAMALVGFARQWKRDRKPKTPAPGVKPCGCKDEA